MTVLKARDLYGQRKFWRLLLLGCAVTIVFFSLAFTYHLARTIEKDEKTRVHDVAEAYKSLVSSTDENEIEEALKITKANKSIPVIWVSSDNSLLDSKNIKNEGLLHNQSALNKYLLHLKQKGHVVSFTVNPNEPPQYLYYDTSNLLKLVRIYPYIIFTLVVLFLVIALIAVAFSRVAVQNQLWAGMAKETAHQLGTPISSLSAWIDYLEQKFNGSEDEFIITELKKDVSRLELVADRFSKIGSTPALHPTNVVQAIEKTVDYIKTRAGKKVQFKIEDKTAGDNQVMLNASLFEWVMENLLKNALDAMSGVGNIHITLSNIRGVLTIDVKDNGKGIQPGKIKSIFEPGFSTKKRGWGLGLSLTKRIVEEYHKGKIFVKESIPGKGTTFRIEFRRDIY